MKFYLGTHLPSWLPYVNHPLLVSRRTLPKHLRRAKTNWALDSGGFTELSMYGKWTISAADYTKEVRRIQSRVGSMDFAAQQDWMCEPAILKKTTLSVKEHQQRTIDNYLELCQLDPTIPWLPVLQGWTLDDYLQIIDLYYKHNVPLHTLPLVGLGSVCRRQNTKEIESIIYTITTQVPNIQLHGFGIKSQGLRLYGRLLASCDSMAWSYQARYSPPLPECATQHKNCANCQIYAELWREAYIMCYPFVEPDYL